jgi:hypothetical protein
MHIRWYVSYSFFRNMQHLKTTPQQTANRLLLMTSKQLAVQVCEKLINYSHCKMLTVHYMSVMEILLSDDIDQMLLQHENERFYLYHLN